MFAKHKFASGFAMHTAVINGWGLIVAAKPQEGDQ
jgi:hypothetical protein